MDITHLTQKAAHPSLLLPLQFNGEWSILDTSHNTSRREGRVHAGARGSEPEIVKVRHPYYVECHPLIS